MGDFPEFSNEFFKLLEQYEGSRVPSKDWARYRQGSQAKIWSRPGTGSRTTLGGFIQVGSWKWTGAAATSGSESTTFPVAFADEPLVFVNCVYSWPPGVQVTCRPWSDGAGLEILWWSGANVTELWFHWLAYGPGDIA